MANKKLLKIERTILKVLSIKNLLCQVIQKFYINIIKIKIISGKINVYIKPLKNKIIDSYIIKNLNAKSNKYNKTLFKKIKTKYNLKIKFYILYI